MHALNLARYQSCIRYHDLAGSDVTCVFIHDLGSSSSADFSEVVAEPALRGYRSILIDLLGFGFSDRPETFSYSLQAHAQTIETVIKTLELSQCVVVGHGLGGSIGVLVATFSPEHVGAVICVEAILEPGPNEGRNAALGQLIASQPETAFTATGFPKLVSDSRREESVYAGSLQHAAPFALHRTSVSLETYDEPTIYDRFLRLTTPRAYIIGETSLEDKMMAKRADSFRTEGITVAIAPGVGHSMGLGKNPSIFATVVGSTLKDALQHPSTSPT
jgi:pimeloyl-ACP methyl ester carboxylesterase